MEVIIKQNEKIVFDKYDSHKNLVQNFWKYKNFDSKA